MGNGLKVRGDNTIAFGSNRTVRGSNRLAIGPYIIDLNAFRRKGEVYYTVAY